MRITIFLLLSLLATSLQARFSTWEYTADGEEGVFQTSDIPIGRVGRAIARSKTEPKKQKGSQLATATMISRDTSVAKPLKSDSELTLQLSLHSVGTYGFNSSVDKERERAAIYSMGQEIGISYPLINDVAIGLGYSRNRLKYNQQYGSIGYLYEGITNGGKIFLSENYFLFNELSLETRIGYSYVQGELTPSSQNMLSSYSSMDLKQSSASLSFGPKYCLGNMMIGLNIVAARHWVNVADDQRGRFMAFGAQLNLGIVL